MALKVGELFATLNLATGDFSKGLSKAQSLFKKAGLVIADMGMDVAQSMVNIGMSFESAMSDVQAISGATGEELKQLRDTAKKYGSTTAFTATESAQALKYMALAGWDANQSMEALPGVLDMAAASGMDLAAASDAVTDYISAFGLEAKDATYMADAMAKAQATANTSAQQLAEAWGNSAASMHAAGQDMETTTAALMIFADQGMKGSEAGTALSAMMRDITQKMENGAIKIGDASIAVQDAQGNFRDLNDIITDVAAATDGMGSAEKSAALMTTFTARSIKGVNMLLNAGVGELNEYEAAVRGSAGTASDQAATMLDNLKGDITIFQSALEGLQLDMFESSDSILRDAVQGATGVITAFQQAVQSGFSAGAIADAIEQSFEFLDGIGSRIGDGAMQILQGFTRVLPTIGRGINSGLKRIVAGAKKYLPGVLKGLFKAIPGLVKGFMTDVLPELVSGAFDLLGSLAEQIVLLLPNIVPTLVNGVIGIVPKVLDGVGRVVAGLGKGISNIFGYGFDMEDALDALLSQADQDYMAEIKAQIDGELTYEPLLGEIDSAIADIQAALQGLSLDPDVESAIIDSVKSGSGVELFQATLKSLGVDAGEAQRIAGEIGKAGVDIKAELLKLGIDEATAASLAAAAENDRTLIDASLRALGIPETTITQILDGYDTARNSFEGQITSVFDDIYNALTDGKPDTPDIISGLEDEIRGIYADAREKISTWRDEELAKLDPMSLTYAEDVQAITDKASEMSASLEAQEQAALGFITSMAGLSAEAVRQHKGTLDQMVADLLETVKQIDSIGTQTSLEFKAFQLVSSGMSTNARTVGQALDYAYAELLKNQSDGLEKFGNAMDEATKKGDAETLKRLDAEYKAFEAQYNALYESRLAGIFSGIASQTVDPDILAGLQQDIKKLDMFGTFKDWLLKDADISAIPDGIEAAFKEAVSACDLGDAEQLWQSVLRDGYYDTLGGWVPYIEGYIEQSIRDATDSVTNTLNRGDLEFPELASALQQAIDSGLLNESESFKDLAADDIKNLFKAVFATPIDVPGPTATVDTEGLTQSVEDAMDEVDSTFESALTDSGEIAGASVEATIDATASVDTVTVQTGDGSGIEDAARTALEAQNLDIPIDAAVSLNVSVEDSNAASVGAAAGVELGQALAAGIGTTTSEVSKAAGKVARAALSAISGVKSSAKNSGMYFATGFAQGIRNGTNSVANAARALAQSAISSLQAGIKQGSPSKLTMESGAFFGEGFGLGILKELRFVRGAAGTIADTALASLNALRTPETGFTAQLAFAGDSIARRSANDFGRIYGALESIVQKSRPEPIDYDRLADAMNQRGVALYQNGREVARISARDNARAQNNLNRRINLSVGK